MDLDYLRGQTVLVVGDGRPAYRRACAFRAAGAHVTTLTRHGEWSFDTGSLPRLAVTLGLEGHVVHAPELNHLAQIRMCHAVQLDVTLYAGEDSRRAAMRLHPAGSAARQDDLIREAWLVEIVTDDDDLATEWAERAAALKRPVARRAAPQPVDVTLVGGGPGGSELLTVAGLAALEEADVVFVDRLGPGREVPHLAPGALVIDVGKAPGHHRVPQAQIEDLLLRFAAEGARVVRLKGGDPFVFGRGGEELSSALEAGLSVDSIPGITSAIAVPAAVGIPVTHREVTRAFTVISGHEEFTDAECRGLIDTGGTIVILMGIGTLEPNVRGLLRHGLPGETPVSIVENGHTPQQREVRASLAEVSLVAARERVRNPAVIVIGNTVEKAANLSSDAATVALQDRKSNLQDLLAPAKLRIVSDSPEPRDDTQDVLPLLRGYRIAVTADRRSNEQIEAFQRRGADVLHAPTMRIVPVADDATLRSDTAAIVRARPDIALITTAQGLYGWLDAQADTTEDATLPTLPTLPTLHETLARAEILVRGPKARGGVRARGLRDAGVATDETTASLVDLALERAAAIQAARTRHQATTPATGLTIALQLHGYTDEQQIARLTAAGHRVLTAAPYRWQGPPDPQAVTRLLDDIIERRVHAVTFTAAPAAASLLAVARASGLTEPLREAFAADVLAAAVGPVTAQPLLDAGVRTSFPPRHRLGALVKHVSESLLRDRPPMHAS
ncbi:uroporphyrinogen-III C-methyltransferase [Micrococcales bacterium 31B]|nr:uroporphyrinogen-III C-methyltransferase [Micrococcales bacterium 31B]